MQRCASSGVLAATRLGTVPPAELSRPSLAAEVENATAALARTSSAPMLLFVPSARRTLWMVESTTPRGLAVVIPARSGSSCRAHTPVTLLAAPLPAGAPLHAPQTVKLGPAMRLCGRNRRATTQAGWPVTMGAPQPGWPEPEAAGRACAAGWSGGGGPALVAGASGAAQAAPGARGLTPPRRGSAGAPLEPRTAAAGASCAAPAAAAAGLYADEGVSLRPSAGGSHASSARGLPAAAPKGLDRTKMELSEAMSSLMQMGAKLDAASLSARRHSVGRRSEAARGQEGLLHPQDRPPQPGGGPTTPPRSGGGAAAAVTLSEGSAAELAARSGHTRSFSSTATSPRSDGGAVAAAGDGQRHRALAVQLRHANSVDAHPMALLIDEIVDELAANLPPTLCATGLPPAKLKRSLAELLDSGGKFGGPAGAGAAEAAAPAEGCRALLRVAFHSRGALAAFGRAARLACGRRGLEDGGSTAARLLERRLRATLGLPDEEMAAEGPGSTVSTAQGSGCGSGGSDYCDTPGGAAGASCGEAEFAAPAADSALPAWPQQPQHREVAELGDRGGWAGLVDAATLPSGSTLVLPAPVSVRRSEDPWTAVGHAAKTPWEKSAAGPRPRRPWAGAWRPSDSGCRCHLARRACRGRRGLTPPPLREVEQAQEAPQLRRARGDRPPPGAATEALAPCCPRWTATSATRS